MIQTQLVIIQPTSLCNINCDYCYLPQRSVKKRMSIATVEQIGKVLFSSPFVRDTVGIVWHAGEPLVLPISFYERAFDCLQRQNAMGLPITHSFQTNATLITQEWCDFFKQQGVRIGVSLDGPQSIHDAHRKDWAGHGTFERVMKGVHLLQHNAIPFTVIAVITKQTLPHAEEFWRFFAEIRPTRLCLNPEEQEGVNRASSLEERESVEQYKQFLKELLLINTRADQPLKIREFETIHEHVKTGVPLARSQTNTPGVIFSFDCDGSISTFSPELLTMSHPTYTNFLFGNVFDDTLEESLHTAKFRAINEEIQRGGKRCLQTCKYFFFCGGGFPSNKLSEHGTFEVSETQSCRLRIQAPTDVMLEYWEERYHLGKAQDH